MQQTLQMSISCLAILVFPSWDLNFECIRRLCLWLILSRPSWVELPNQTKYHRHSLYSNLRASHSWREDGCCDHLNCSRRGSWHQNDCHQSTTDCRCHPRRACLAFWNPKGILLPIRLLVSVKVESISRLQRNQKHPCQVSSEEKEVRQRVCRNDHHLCFLLRVENWLPPNRWI